MHASRCFWIGVLCSVSNSNLISVSFRHLPQEESGPGRNDSLRQLTKQYYLQGVIIFLYFSFLGLVVKFIAADAVPALWNGTEYLLHMVCKGDPSSIESAKLDNDDQATLDRIEVL